MTPQLSYTDLVTLMNLDQAKESLEQYMVIIKEMMKNHYPDYPYTIEFDVEKNRYVFIQKGHNFSIETGFWWDVKDLYFGMKVIVPYDIYDIDQIPFDFNWGYGVEDDQYSYNQLIRYADFMIVGNPSMQYITVLEKFKTLCLESREVVQIAKKSNKRK